MKYYNGLNDIVFKNTLCVEEHKGLLKWLLESCLDIKIDNLILTTELGINIVKQLRDECKEKVLSKMKELKYNSTTCYSVAAIALFLDTLSRDEREEILNILNLQEK